MSVIGIDFGNATCFVATNNRGAIEIVRNDISERATPSVVGFTDVERLIGDAAIPTLKSNFKNTCRNIKQLLGQTMESAQVQREQANSLSPLKQADQLVGYEIQYKNDTTIFSVTRVFAALLTKLKQTAEKWTNNPISDCAISAPAWYDDRSRQAILDAAFIAGLNCLRVINETTAVALDYGIDRAPHFGDTESRIVVFVGVGHSNTFVSVTEFKKIGSEVLFDVSRSIGGRDIDYRIMQHFANIFQKQKGINPLNNKKAVLKMEDAAEKCKTILSSNQEAPFNIECVVGDDDITGLLTRTDFNALCEDLQEQLKELLLYALQSSGKTIEQIYEVEIVGGSTRIPWVQKVISDTFCKDLSRTLNMDESVARGCFLQAAMLSPFFRVRQFDLIDKFKYDIVLSWEGAPTFHCDQNGVEVEEQAISEANNVKSTLLFKHGCPNGTCKVITFYRSDKFDIILNEVNSAEEKTPARYTIHVHPLPDGSLRKVKVQICATLHGICKIQKAHIIEIEDYEEIVKEKRKIEKPPNEEDQATESTEGAPMEDVPKPEQQYETVNVVHKRQRQMKTPLCIEMHPRVGWLTEPILKALHEDELNMSNDDRVQFTTREKRNELESYIYNMRNRIQGALAPFMQPREKETFQQLLSDAENWLYDNEGAVKSAFDNKHDELMKYVERFEVAYAGTELDALMQKGLEILQTRADLSSQAQEEINKHIENFTNKKKEQTTVAGMKQLEMDFHASLEKSLRSPTPAPAPEEQKPPPLPKNIDDEHTNTTTE